MLSNNLILHACTKHIELDIHFVRERVVVGRMLTQHVPAAAQIADTLIKLLGTTVFQDLRGKLKVVSEYHCLSV